MVYIRTNCPTKLCYLQKCSVSPYQFILRISINICRVESASVHPPVYILRDICSVCLRIQDFRDQRQAPLTQTPSTPKHTNPIQQSSRNRKAVNPTRQKNPTRPPKQKLFLSFFLSFFSSSLLLFFSPSVIPINAAFLCYTRQGTPPCPRSLIQVRSPRRDTILQMRNSEESSTHPVIRSCLHKEDESRYCP